MEKSTKILLSLLGIAILVNFLLVPIGEYKTKKQEVDFLSALVEYKLTEFENSHTQKKIRYSNCWCDSCRSKKTLHQIVSDSLAVFISTKTGEKFYNIFEK